MTKVYSKSNCPACKATQTLMDREGLQYEKVNIEEDDSNYQLVIDMGYQVVPVVVAGSESWSGFRPDLIKALARS